MVLTDLISGGIKGIFDGIDEIITSDEEKLALKVRAQETMANLATGAMEHEAKLASAQAAVIQVEAGGKSWLQRNWRPILMLTFGVLIVAHWLGFSADGLSEDERIALFEIMKIGIGGYVLGRSAEKIIPSAMRHYAEGQRNTSRQ